MGGKWVTSNKSVEFHTESRQTSVTSLLTKHECVKLWENKLNYMDSYESVQYVFDAHVCSNRCVCVCWKKVFFSVPDHDAPVFKCFLHTSIPSL